MKDLVSVLNIAAMLVLVNSQLRFDGGASDMEMILFWQFFDVDVDSGVAEIVWFVAGLVLGLIVTYIVTDHYIAFFVDLDLDTASIAWGNETEWMEKYLFLNYDV